MCYHIYVKSSEYNNVVVKNEKSNFSGEFTDAQKTEYSFQDENPTTIKDELNDRKVINDNPEENLLKSTKEKKKERKDNKDNTSTSSEATSTSASTASSIGGTVAGVAATAATAAVVVIGAVAGISIIQEQKSNELINFISSEVGTTQVDLVFSVPTSLLSYEEGIQYESSKELIALVENDNGFNKEYYPDLIEETYDSPNLLYSLIIDELSASTDYALTIYLNEIIYSPEEEHVYKTFLGFRTFTTESESKGGDVITFESVEATSTSVSFAFKVALRDIGVDPANPRMPYVYATIEDAYGYSESLRIRDVELDQTGEIATARGGFSELAQATNFIINVYLEDDSHLLGSTECTTDIFGDVNAGRDKVDFTIYLNKDAINYREGETPAIKYAINGITESYYVEAFARSGSFVEVEGNRIMGSASFDSLPINNDYQLSVNLSTETELVFISATTFNTNADFVWVIDPSSRAEELSTFYNFRVNAAYIGFVSQEETPDVINKISAVITDSDSEVVGTYAPSKLQKFNTKVCTCQGDIDNLLPNTSYTIDIYFETDTGFKDLLGSSSFTTRTSSYGFELTSAIVGETSCEFEFNILANQNDVYVKILYEGIAIKDVAVTDWTQTSDIKKGTVTISELPSNTEYIAQFYNHSSSSLVYGSKSFKTLESTSVNYDFVVEDKTIDKDYCSIDFSLNADAFNIDWADERAVDNLQNNISLTYYDIETGYQSETPAGLRKDGDRALANFGIFSLSSNRKYVAVVHYIGDSENIPLGIFTFTTLPGIDSVESDFGYIIDGAGAYKIPMLINFTGEPSYYGENFIVKFSDPSASAPENIYATIPVKEGWQYATFEDSSIANYRQAMQYEIYPENDLDNCLYTGECQISDASTSGNNKIYNVFDMTRDISSTSTSISFSMVAALAEKSLGATLKFNYDGSTILQYELDLSNYDYISNLSIDVLNASESTRTYEDFKDTFRYLQFNVVIEYHTSYATGDTVTLAIYDNFEFNFKD